MLNKDYRDILHALSVEKVKFLIVGAYAMAAHGYPRSTMDIDLWIETSPRNAEGVMRALKRFGAPIMGLTLEDLQTKDIVFQIGVAPRRIDILTSISGLEFNEVYNRSLSVVLDEIEVRIPTLDDLITNKRASGRTQDIADAEALTSLKIKRDFTK